MIRKYDEGVRRRRVLTDPDVGTSTTYSHSASATKPRMKGKPRRKPEARVKATKPVKSSPAPVHRTISHSSESEDVEIEEIGVSEMIRSMEASARQRKLMELVNAAQYMERKMEERVQDLGRAKEPMRTGKRHHIEREASMEPAVAKRVYLGENDPASP